MYLIYFLLEELLDNKFGIMLQSRGESLREEGADEEAEAQETLLQVKGGRAETILTRQTKKSYWTRLRNKLCTAHRFKNLQVSSIVINYQYIIPLSYIEEVFMKMYVKNHDTTSNRPCKIVCMENVCMRNYQRLANSFVTCFVL